MADPADKADVQQQTLLDAAIRLIRSKPLDISNPSEICWSDGCEAHTGPDRRWCDGLCRDIYEKQQRL